MSSGRRFEVNAVQVLASALAAVTGAIAASYLGIAGTIVGAAVMSVASTAVAAVYKHYLGRGHERLVSAAQDIVPLVRDRAVAAAAAAGPHDDAEPPSQAGRTARGTRQRWLMRAAVTMGVFVAAMGGITAFEAVAGKPLDAVVWHRPGSNTTVQNLIGTGTQPRSHSAPKPARSVSPSPSERPVTPTATPSPKPTGSRSPTPSPSPSPSGPSPSPTGSSSRSPAA
jgi:hypothetical protein